jgi:hypothetical protein
MLIDWSSGIVESKQVLRHSETLREAFKRQEVVNCLLVNIIYYRIKKEKSRKKELLLSSRLVEIIKLNCQKAIKKQC